MEASGSSHYCGRQLRALGFEVVLMPPHYLRPYIRRNKTDRTDCEEIRSLEERMQEIRRELERHP